MKLIIRVLALFVVVAGAAAASVSSSPRHTTFTSHQSATAGLPTPGCGPGICPPPGSNQ
jgi:hypothetical protein